MRKDAIQDMVDKIITGNMNDGLPIRAAQLELQEKISKFRKMLEKENVDVVDIVLQANEDWQKISSARHRFAAYYICFAAKRIIDLDWFSKKKTVFTKLSNKDMLKLLKFRDKLSKENANELPF